MKLLPGVLSPTSQILPCGGMQVNKRLCPQLWHWSGLPFKKSCNNAQVLRGL